MNNPAAFARADAVRGVLDRHGALRRDAELLAREPVEFRVGLDPLDVVAGADGDEAVEQAEPAQMTGRPAGARAGRDREPQAELVGLVQAVLDAGEQLGLADELEPALPLPDAGVSRIDAVPDRQGQVAGRVHASAAAADRGWHGRRHRRGRRTPRGRSPDH